MMRSNQRLFLLVLITVILLNFRWGHTIMGFDNASPYYDASVTLYRIFHSGNFFHFGGIIFSPAFILSILNIPAWLNSFITYFGAFIIGMYFASEIIYITHKKTIPWYVLGIILLGNLVPIWIFSIPLLVFVPSFAGIITFVYFLLHSDRLSVPKQVALLIGILYFASTSINVAAFFVYLLQAVTIALIIGKSAKNTLRRAGIFVALWLVIVQVFVINTSGVRSVFEEAYRYGQDLLIDDKTTMVTESLAQMEIQRNSVVNVSRFATGWTKLTDASGDFLFQYGNIIDSIPIIFITMIPVLCTIWIAVSKRDPQQKPLLILWLVGIIACSSYVLIFVKNIEGLQFILRWGSSKLWPMIYIPWILLYSKIYTDPLGSQKVLPRIALIASSVLLIPWIIGIVNARMYISVPQSYEKVFSALKQSDNVLYLPEPQRLYMRQYQWGYYGSSFLPYMTKASIYDQGIFHPNQNDYQRLKTLFNSCAVVDLKQSVNIIIIDQTIATPQAIPACYMNLQNRQKVDNLIIITL